MEFSSPFIYLRRVILTIKMVISAKLPRHHVV